MNIVSYLLTIAAGAANPVQAGANAQLNKGLASPLWAALFVYVSGLAGVLLIQLVVRQAWPGQRLASGLPWWAWSGGLLSIASTLTGLTLAQKLGSGLFTGMTLTASMLMSITLDKFGLVGFERHPLSALRLTGAGFLVAGIWMIAKS
ncbi:MAG: DMT family transporter [Bryobacteraceae bacterium]